MSRLWARVLPEIPPPKTKQSNPSKDDEDTKDTYSFFPLMDNIPSDEEETGGETDDLAGIVSLYEDESGGEDVRRKLRVRKSMKEESKRVSIFMYCT